MKKILFKVLLILPICYQAQVDLISTEFGIVAGLTYSRVRYAHNPCCPRFSVLAGFVAQTPIGITEQLYIQCQILYMGAGESGRMRNAKGRPGYRAVYANNYLSIPIDFKGYFSRAESEFFGSIGARFNLLLVQRVKDAGMPEYGKEIYGKANPLNFAVGAGVGYSYRREWELSLRYDFGLSNTYPKLKDNPSEKGYAGSAKKKSEQVLGLGLTYFFK